MRKINVLLLAAVFCLSLVGLAHADVKSCLRVTGYKVGEATISDETKESLSKAVKDLDKRLLSVKDQSKLSLSVEGAADNAGAKNSPLGRERAEGVVTVLKYLFPQATISVAPSGGSIIKPGEVIISSTLETTKVEAADIVPVIKETNKKELIKAETPKAEIASAPVAKQQKRSNSHGTSWLIGQWVASLLSIAIVIGVLYFIFFKKFPTSSPVVHDDEEEEVIDLGEVAVGTNVLDEIIELAVMAPKVDEVGVTVNEKEAPALEADDVPEIIPVEVVGYTIKVEKLLDNNVAKLESPFTTLVLGVKKMIPKAILFDDTPAGMEQLKTSLKKCLGSVQYNDQKAELLKAGIITKSLPAVSAKTSTPLHVVGKKAEGPAVAAQTVAG